MMLLGATAMAVLVAVPTADARAPRPADTVLRNGYVYTVDAKDSVRQAVAVRRGKVVYVGSNRGARRFIGSRTVVRNAGGRMIMPGLHDGHMHPLGGGAGLLKCSLDYQPLTIADFKARIAKCLSDTTEDEPDTWLQAINWYQEAMIPAGTKVSKEDLDALTTKRPIVVQSSFGHSTVVNSRALALANITAATPDPAGGKIWRDAAGNPTGLLDDAAQGLIDDVVPAPTAAENVASARAALDAMRRQGITSFLDAAASPTSLGAFTAVQRQGGLTARAHFAPVIDDRGGQEPGQGRQGSARDEASLRPGRDQAAAVDHPAQRQAVHGRRPAGPGPDRRPPEALPHQRRHTRSTQLGSRPVPRPDLLPARGAEPARDSDRQGGLRSAHPLDRRPRGAADAGRLRVHAQAHRQGTTSGPPSPTRRWSTRPTTAGSGS